MSVGAPEFESNMHLGGGIEDPGKKNGRGGSFTMPGIRLFSVLLTPLELRGLLIEVLHIIVKVAEFIGIDVHNQQTQAARILRSGQALLTF